MEKRVTARTMKVLDRLLCLACGAHIVLAVSFLMDGRLAESAGSMAWALATCTIAELLAERRA